MELPTNTPMDMAEALKVINRLKESGIDLNRFVKVGGGWLKFDLPEYPRGYYNDKAPFEKDFETKPYTFTAELFGTWPRFGILGCRCLVLLDFDKQEMYDIMKPFLPETLEVTSPRHGTPHVYLIVWCDGKEKVPNFRWHIEATLTKKAEKTQRRRKSRQPNPRYGRHKCTLPRQKNKHLENRRIHRN